MSDNTVKTTKDVGPIGEKLNQIQQMRFEAEQAFLVLSNAISPVLESEPPTDEASSPDQYDSNDSEILHALELERVGLRELRDHILRIKQRVQL